MDCNVDERSRKWKELEAPRSPLLTSPNIKESVSVRTARAHKRVKIEHDTNQHDPSLPVQHASASFGDLPAELIEKIFLYFPNPNLPLVSRLFLTVLSTDRSQIKAAIQTFSHVHQINRSSHDANRSTPETEPRMRTLFYAADRRRLQMSIRKCRFFTLPFLKRCVNIYTEAIIREEWTNRGIRTSEEEEAKKLHSIFELRQPCPEVVFIWAKAPGGQKALMRFHSWPRLIGIGSRGLGATYYSLPATADMLPFPDYQFPLPSKVLHGPWSDEKLDFLKLLIKCGGIYKESKKRSASASKGITDAIRERNYHVLSLLVHRDYSDTQDTNLNQSLGIMPQRHHFQTAIVDAQCDLQALRTLLLGSHTAEGRRQSVIDRVSLASEVISGDKAIVAWAVKTRDQGDERGQWVLDLAEKRVVSEEVRRFLGHPWEYWYLALGE
ncbi:hypothetical protein MMC12_000177 [Toensbergia leucococca]|nr:hypothetical protein [Toensbergia leucococca]